MKLEEIKQYHEALRKWIGQPLEEGDPAWALVQKHQGVDLLAEAIKVAEAQQEMLGQCQRHFEFLAKLAEASRVRRGVIGSRPQAADALLDYRDPPSTERADRLAVLEKREAEMVAMIETLRGALERISAIAEYDTSFGKAAAKNRYLVPYDEFEAMRELLKVTPPQALAQQRERMEKALMVVEAAREFMTAHDEDACNLALRLAVVGIRKSLAALDAERAHGAVD